MHYEYYSIYMNIITLIHVARLIVRYAYISDRFYQCNTFYLAHIYEPKTMSANFLKGIQIYFDQNSLWTNTGLININLLIVNTHASGSFCQRKTVYLAHEVITKNAITAKSENFVQRLVVIIEPRSCPQQWTEFLGIPLTYPQPTGIPEVSQTLCKLLNSDISSLRHIADGTSNLNGTKKQSLKRFKEISSYP